MSTYAGNLGRFWEVLAWEGSKGVYWGVCSLRVLAGSKGEDGSPDPAPQPQPPTCQPHSPIPATPQTFPHPSTPHLADE